MENVDELPSWAGRTHEPGSNLPPAATPPPRDRHPLRIVLYGVLALVAMGAMVGLGYWIATATTDGTEVTADDAIGSEESTDAAAGTSTDDDASEETAAQGAAAEGESGDDAATGEGSDQSSSAADGSSAGDGDTAAESPAPSGEVVDNSDGSIRYAVLKGGQLYLRGRVPSEELGTAIEDVAIGVLGPGNVFNEYDVDPSTPETTNGPIYVEDVVLFGFNSVEIDPAFTPILDLGTKLMTLNPSVRVTVVSRTDAVGSEEVNLEVSRQRAQAVVDYWVRQGIDADRLEIDPRGEEEASDADTAQEAARNRRVEFVINDLFG